MEHKESVHRNTTPVENIKLFEKLLKGEMYFHMRYCVCILIFAYKHKYV